MSLWSRIADALAALASGEGLANVFDKLRTPPEQRVGFAIAVIALGAKMAKADGQVTRDEVMAFREVFSIPSGEEQNAARVFNMARTDVAGFEEYASRVAKMFGPGSASLCDVIEGLFHIALADGQYHPGEDAYLARVAELFGIDARRFRAMRARFVPGEKPDPFEVLGVDPDAPVAEIRSAYRALVRDTHPDALAARGVPPEAVKLAQDRLVCINSAWDEVQALKAQARPA